MWTAKPATGRGNPSHWEGMGGGLPPPESFSKMNPIYLLSEAFYTTLVASF